MIPKNITLKRSVALVMCLAMLHILCIDERETTISPLTATDEATIELERAVPLQPYGSNTPEGQHTSDQPLPISLILPATAGQRCFTLSCLISIGAEKS
jgi:hypothetical protein